MTNEIFSEILLQNGYAAENVRCIADLHSYGLVDKCLLAIQRGDKQMLFDYYLASNKILYALCDQKKLLEQMTKHVARRLIKPLHSLQRKAFDMIKILLFDWPILPHRFHTLHLLASIILLINFHITIASSSSSSQTLQMKHYAFMNISISAFCFLREASVLYVLMQ